MRILFWYCTKFSWTPAMKTIDEAPEAEPGDHVDSVVAFIHVEPADVEEGSTAETRLVKYIKWLARKWDTKSVLLHSFTHLGEEKADPDAALALLKSTETRLLGSGYDVCQTPWGYFLNLSMDAPGKPLARIYQTW